MKITPVAGPAKVGENLNQSNQASQDARARAIAMLTGSKPQAEATPVPAEVAQAQANANVSEPRVESEKGQKDPIENPAEVPKAETSAKAEEPISSQYAVLARKEKALRAKVQAQEAALKAREAAIAEREAKLAAKDTEYQQDYIPKSKLTEDTIMTLLEAGISYDKITEMALQQQSSPVDPQTRMVIKQLQEEIKALKADTEGTKKTILDSQQQNYQQAVRQIRQDVASMVKEGTDFEAIRETGSVDDVVELIEKTFKEDGALLSNEEAARQVEEELVDRISKYARLSKIQQKYAKAPQAQPETSAKSQGEKQIQPPKTLTNNLTNTRELSSRERAILAFKGELPSKK